MRALSEFIMRGRLQAAFVAVLASATPMMFWLSAAAVALVTLRRGFSDGLQVALWAILPAIAWTWAGQPLGLLCIVITMVLAMCLRRTMSWSSTLLGVLPTGLVAAWCVVTYYGPQMNVVVSAFHKFYGSDFSTAFAHGAKLTDTEFRTLIEASFLKSVSLTACISSVLSLVLGRFWQSRLYNPGGLREELLELRFSPTASFIMLLMLTVVSFSPGLVAAAMQPVTIVPLLVAGAVLVHALLWKQGMGQSWFVLFYILLLAVYPVVVLLACLDSLLNIRARLEHRMSD
ncbi:hypothetical protein [Parendozoicomonas sp. Alg238-R29]|uniref:hypothetical protein n=1 Tax=Parendozoicomonas sp. Alg238-R29 TaxID=2993446 RepID=UPI00248EA040|nr:hypothetical protein [Parendozoicomonas sp. Alg238-R29]